MGTKGIKKISVEHSLEESRKIINKNFDDLSVILDHMNRYNGQFLENLQLPNDPLGNVKYVIRYDVSRRRYVIEPDSVTGSSSILDIVQKWSGEQGKNVNFIIVPSISEYESLDVSTRESSVIYVKDTRDVIICDRNLTDFTKDGVIRQIQDFFTEKNEEFSRSIKDFNQKLRSYKMGIQKTYSSIEEMENTGSPTSEDGKSLEDGSIIAIYDKTRPEYEHNGKLFTYNPSSTTDRWIEVGKMSQSLGAQFTDEEKLKLSVIKNDGESNMFLSADGTYRRIIIPSAPIQKIFVNQEEVLPDPTGVVRIDVGKGNVKTIQVGDEPPINPTEDGNLRIPVDIELDSNSMNPVSNSIVSQRIEDLERSKITSLDSELLEDGVTMRISLYDEKRGEKFGGIEIPVGGGGGGEPIQRSKLILTSEVSKKHVRLGDTSAFSYTYDYKNADGESTGIRSKIDLMIKQGAITLFAKTYDDVSAGTYSLSLFEYLKEGSIDIYVKCTITDESGEQKTKQSYQSVRVYDVKLGTSYKLSSNGPGYKPSDNISIPFHVIGAGDKTVRLICNGSQLQSQNITKSGVSNGLFSIPASTLPSGISNISLVTDVSVPGSTIRSNSIHFQIKVGEDKYSPFALFKFSDKIGRTYDANDALSIVAQQFDEFSISYYAYDPSKTKSRFTLIVGDQENEMEIDRTDHVYTGRFVDRASKKIRIKFYGNEFSLPISIERSSIDIEKVSDSILLELSASGRSNSENNPLIWKYRNIETTFHQMNLSSGGWINGGLSLINGSSIEIGYKPFASDPTISGKTFEFEFSCDTVSDRNMPIIHSLDSNIGISITPILARIQSASGTYVETKFASGKFYKIAFVISKKTENRLLEIYVDGVRCGAVQYPTTDSFLQQTPKNITINSFFSNVHVRSVRIHDRALTDDEILTNYIIDRQDPQDILRLYAENDVLDDSGNVSMQKLLSKGKSVMKMTADIDLVNKTNNKKFEVPVNVDYFSKFGKDFSFNLNRGRVRIQGTSSTTYPRKNYRLYFDVKKKDPENTLTVGGVLKSKNRYAFKPDSPEVGLFTMKADFAESSSTHNSGLAIIINNIFKQCGFLVPPQRKDINVRIGVDGQPCDIFVDNLDGSVKYIGKYNFNNDKAKSDHVYGFSGDNCICLEFLNNSSSVGLFQTDDMANHFDNGLEFRYPEDMTWKDAGDRQRHIRRLWGWIKSCVGRPDKFRREVREYFDINFLCGWYVMTEYFMMVDQRVKNMMMATWDGNLWYFIPYDNDTILGVRNDGKLVYDYDIDHETYDDSVQHHAYAGHDSELWKLVRQALSVELQEVAQKIRSIMSKEYVLDVLNKEFMSNWSARIYNKDSEYKYIKPLLEDNINYLYSLQGDRKSHREYIINNRFDLLDAKYLAGTYRADNIRVYFSHNFSTDNREIRIKSTEQYHFGYGFTSGAPKQSGIIANAQNNYQVSLRFFMDLMMNDPQFIYGASRMQEIDFRNISKFILNNIDFSNCKSLKKLNLSCEYGNTTLQSITLSSCTNLEELDIKGLSSERLTALDLSGNTKLRKIDARRTKLQSISFASGSLIEEIYLPSTFNFLQLRGLKRLRWENVHIEDKSKITKLWIENCDNINWEDIIGEFPNLQNIRIYGISKRGKTDFFEKYKDLGGITADGSLRTESGFVGTYILEKYLTDEEFEKWQRIYPEISIEQPEYSVISVSQQFTNEDGLTIEVKDSQRLSNLDNETGYLFGKPYVVSGHVKRIIENRRKYRSKEEKRGKMVVFPLHDMHSGKYDTNENIDLCEDADIHIAESGGIWVKEPHSWRKGVYDYETNTDYLIWSSNIEEPKRPEGKRLDYMWFRKNYVQRYYIQPKSDCIGKNVEDYIYKYKRSFPDSDVNANRISYVKIDVEGFRRIKFPMMNRGSHSQDDGSVNVYDVKSKANLGEYYWERLWNIGAVFTDENGVILRYILLDHEEYNFMQFDFGCAIPDGAKYLYTTIITDYTRHEVYEAWLTNSDIVADWEPDWEKFESKWIAHNVLAYNRNKSTQPYPGIVNMGLELKPEWNVVQNRNFDSSPIRTPIGHWHSFESVSNFQRQHGYYKSMDYVTYSYLWHLAVCAYGRFDFLQVTGVCGNQNNVNLFFHIDPRWGIRDTRCIHADDVSYRSRPLYPWKDEFGQYRFIQHPQSQVLCYGWFSGIPVMLQPRIVNREIYSKNGDLLVHRYVSQIPYGDNFISMTLNENNSISGATFKYIIPLSNGLLYGRWCKTMNHGKRLLIAGRSFKDVNEWNGCNVNMDMNYSTISFSNNDYHGSGIIGRTSGGILPIFVGDVEISNNIEEFKKLKHYQFLKDEKFVP